MSSTISAVGSQVSSGNVTLPTTFNVSPNAVGNMIALATLFAGSADASAVSGGNCTWTKVTASAFNSTLSTILDLWIGVATNTGSSPITVTTSATSAVFTYQEFTVGGPGSTWSVDSVQSGSTNSTGSSTSETFPTLVPTGANELYWGYGYGGTAGSVTSGYTLQIGSTVFSFIYDTSVSGSQTPVVTQSSSAYQTCGALIIGNGPGSLPFPPLVNWQDSPSGATPLDANNLNATNTVIEDVEAAVEAAQPDIPFTGVQTASSITAVPNTFALLSTASNNVTYHFPVAPPNFTIVGAKQVIRGGTNTVTLQLGGSDAFDVVGGTQTGTLTLVNQSGLWQYNAATAVYVKISDNLPLSQLDARYVSSVTAADSSITVAGTSTAPTVKVAQSNLTLAESQITNLVSNLNQTNQGGGVWGSNVYGNQMSNMAIDDATGTYLMVTGFKTLLMLVGFAPAATYSTFKLYVTNAAASSTLTVGLYSASTLTNTSWSRLGSGNITPTITSPGLVSTAISFTLASPAYVVAEMVLTTATNFPTFAASATGTAGLLNPSSGSPVAANLNASSAPGSTLNPTTGFTNMTQKVWCALA